jgi:hypothetical protein
MVSPTWGRGTDGFERRYFSFSATASGWPSGQTSVDTVPPNDGLHESGGGAVEVGLLLGCTALAFGSYITRRIDVRRYLGLSRRRSIASRFTST